MGLLGGLRELICVIIYLLFYTIAFSPIISLILIKGSSQHSCKLYFLNVLFMEYYV